MIRRLPPLALLILALGSVSGHAWASNKTQKLHDQLKHINAERDKHESKAAALDQKQKETRANLDALRQKLIQATNALQTKAAEQDELQDKQDALAQDIEAKQKALDDERRNLDILTGAMVRAAQRPPASLFLQTQLTNDQIHTTLLLRALLPQVQSQATQITLDMNALNAAKAELDKQNAAIESARGDLKKQEADINGMIRTRQGLLKKTESEKQAVAQKLVALTGEANNIQQLLERISPKKHSSGPPTKHLEGTIRAPVSGRIVRRFGDKDSDGVTSAGVTFAAPSGAPIVAPRAGRVVFAGPFRGYGQVLILAHKNGDHSFMAGFGRLDVEMGQNVEAGEPLGTLPAKSASRPELYFEWRRNNDPIDPTEALIRK